MPKIHGDSTERATMDRDQIAESTQVRDHGGTQISAPVAEGDRDAAALERYQARRIAEIRAGAPLRDRGFVSLERLRELADEGTGEGGPLGP